MVETVRLVCPLNNHICGKSSADEPFSCVMQCSCPVPIVKNLKLVFCPFDGSLCSGLVMESDDSGIVSFCRDTSDKWAYTCRRFDGRFARVLRDAGFEF